MGTEQVVFLHGLGAGPDSWDAELAALPDGFAGSAPHITGLSDQGDGLFTFGAAAEEVVDGLDRRGIGRAHLCGLSIGAMLSLWTALEYPDRVASLVLSGGQVRPPRAALALQTAVFRVLPEGLAEPGGMDKRRFLAALEEVGRVDFSERLAEVGVPTLVMCGSWDVVNLPAARTMAEGLPHAQLRIVQGGGHELNVGRPADFAAALHRFYAGPAAPA
ncbi:alpha/beta fold hydrolase [Nocardiopsis sp. HNM0947]|uniref:Alpha/beta fold hydrolase n=1 Tax=Nocardiopsis coralli TaxID=2772213 RepID=A0ABR9P3P4_9ACTN|nr:alpha/beta hydrolase [Nocardiopsis coralli]MBE2998461.1 alpha/beta fold hydrolase [Nocardiopsis coralli]